MIPVYDQFGFVNPRNAALAGAGGVGGRHPMGDVWDRMNHYLEGPAFPGRYTGGGPGYRGWGGSRGGGWGGSANIYYNNSLFGPNSNSNFFLNASLGRNQNCGWGGAPGWGWSNPGWGWGGGPGWNQGGIDLGYSNTSFGPNSVSNFGINGHIPGGSIPKPIGTIAGLGALGVLGAMLFS